MYYDKTRIDNIGTLTVSGTTELVWAPGQAVKVKRVIMHTSTAVTVADATVSVKVRDLDGTPTATKGSFVVPFTGSAIDDTLFADIAANQTGPTTAADGSTVYAGGAGEIAVGQGEEFVLVSDGGSTAGAVTVYVEYVPEGFNGVDGVGTKLAYTTA